MHMGARRPGIPTRDEVADRESQAWDEMVNAMMEEHIARYLEGVEARSLAEMVQDQVPASSGSGARTTARHGRSWRHPTPRPMHLQGRGWHCSARLFIY